MPSGKSVHRTLIPHPDAGVRCLLPPPRTLVPPPELNLKVEGLDDNFLVFTVENIPHDGQVFHLRQSTDGVTFEPLFPPFHIWDSNPQPYAIPVDPTASPTLLLQIYEGASPDP